LIPPTIYWKLTHLPCAQNSDLVAFVEQVNPKVGLSSWMVMLWVEPRLVVEGVLNRMEKETRETVHERCEVSGDITLLNRTRHCKPWIEILDKYLEVWEERLGSLGPEDQAVSGLQTRLESAIRARKHTR